VALLGLVVGLLTGVFLAGLVVGSVLVSVVSADWDPSSACWVAAMLVATFDATLAVKLPQAVNQIVMAMMMYFWEFMQIFLCKTIPILV
jgi:hypothetical protein